MSCVGVCVSPLEHWKQESQQVSGPEIELGLGLDKELKYIPIVMSKSWALNRSSAASFLVFSSSLSLSTFSLSSLIWSLGIMSTWALDLNRSQVSIQVTWFVWTNQRPVLPGLLPIFLQHMSRQYWLGFSPCERVTNLKIASKLICSNYQIKDRQKVLSKGFLGFVRSSRSHNLNPSGPRLS